MNVKDRFENPLAWVAEKCGSRFEAREDGIFYDGPSGGAFISTKNDLRNYKPITTKGYFSSHELEDILECKRKMHSESLYHNIKSAVLEFEVPDCVELSFDKDILIINCKPKKYKIASYSYTLTQEGLLKKKYSGSDWLSPAREDPSEEFSEYAWNLCKFIVENC